MGDLCVCVCGGETKASCYVTFLLHLDTPNIKLHTDIMFVCSSVAMATAVSACGGAVAMSGEGAKRRSAR